LTASESTLASGALGFFVLFHAFSPFFMKSMKKVEKAPKSKQGVFLMSAAAVGVSEYMQHTGPTWHATLWTSWLCMSFLPHPFL